MDILGNIPLCHLKKSAGEVLLIFMEPEQKQRTMEAPVPRLAQMLRIVDTASRMKDAIFGHKLAYS